MNESNSELQFDHPLILQGNQLEDLRQVMVSWMQRHPLKPFEDEVILVQSNGIAQWLKLALAADTDKDTDKASDPEKPSGLGIAAGIQVMLPGRFIWQAYRKLFPQLPSASPFDKGPLTWRLHGLLNRLPELQATLTDATLLQPIQHFLDQDASTFRTWQLAARLADLFDQYQIYRADWLAAWLNGEDVLIRVKGQREQVPVGQRWQPLLWRWLHQDISQSNVDQPFLSYASRASVHQHFCDQLQITSVKQTLNGIPKRIIVFGISSLPRQTLEVLSLLAPYSQVMLFVCNPSEHYWGDLIEGRELFRQAYRRNPINPIPADVDENLLHLHGHPLLASWGRQGRDYLRLLDEYDDTASYRDKFEKIDIFTAPLQDCLLHQLQKDIFDLKSLKERQGCNTQVAAEDRSLSFMIAHSPQREIEILQDQLLAEFEKAQQQGQSLTPRDILVMVPDIQDYAAHIDAVFGKLDYKDPRYLPFHVADQGQRHKAPLLIALEHLFHLPESRFSVSELLDLLDVPALRKRFALSEADCTELKQWIQGANIRWGLDAKQRAHLQLPEVEGNSWRFGLKRMLLGYATGEQGAWQDSLPYAEVAGLGATKLGSLVTLIDQLEAAWHELQSPTTAEMWVQRLQSLLADFFTAETDHDLNLLLKIEKQLEQWLVSIQLAEADELELSLDVVREEVLSGLDQQSLNQTFFAGSINFATLMPMRAIPFKQIWLLGMNDGAYPRPVRPVAFDLMASDYRPGDRSRREDDRYLFLEAMLSARNKLVISWVGRNVRDNSVRPSSVLVGQLRDHLKAGWQGQTDDLLNELTTEHPLQPFSSVYFSQAAERTGSLFSYASEWLSVYQAKQKVFDPSGIDSDVLAVSLPAWQADHPLSLHQLIQHLKLPLDSFYALRLQVPRTDPIQQLKDSENFSFDGLENWQLKDRLIEASIIPAQDPQDYEQRVSQQVKRLQQEGVFIEGSLGEYQGQQLIEGLETLYQVWSLKRQTYPTALEPVTTHFSHHSEWGELSIETSLDCFYQDPNSGEIAQLILQSSHLFNSSQKRRWPNYLKGWLMHLLAQQAGFSVTTHLMSPEGQVSFLPADSQEEVENQLHRLWDHVHLSLQKPVVVSLETSIAWLDLQDRFNPTGFDSPEVEAAMIKALEDDLRKSRFLHHHCGSLEHLWMEGEFLTLATGLYGDFYQAVKHLKREKRS